MIRNADFETCRFRPGLKAPPPVCLSIYDGTDGGRLYPTDEIPGAFAELLDSDLIVGHHIAYDMAVAQAWIPGALQEIWDAYETSRVLDTMIFERIAEISGLTSRKHLDLGTVCRAHGVAEPDKGAAVRTDFGRLYGQPLEAYPAEHVGYALDDVRAGYTLFDRQCKRFGVVDLADLAMLCRKQFALLLVSNYGFRTDPKQLETLERETRDRVDELREFVQDVGFVRSDGTRNMSALRAWVKKAYSGTPPMTRPAKARKSAKRFVPQISTSRATLQEAGDFVLDEFADYGELSAVLNKDIALLASGTKWPIHTRFGIADTTRATSSDPNVQNFRRKEGIRECIVPRTGSCFVDLDYTSLESVCLAQTLINVLGRHGLADKLISGVDVHSEIGCVIDGLSYEEFVRRYNAGDAAADNTRTCAKVPNFGRPGGMGWKTLILFARQAYRKTFTPEFAQRICAVWDEKNPDCVEYHDWVKSQPQDAEGRFVLTIPGTQIRRARMTFCSACNNGFQALGAVMTGHVAWLLQKEIFTGALGYARVVNYTHDDFMCEVPIGRQTDFADAASKIMIEGARKYLPDVPIGVDAKAMARWSKRAHSKRTNGELTIWSPK